MSPDCYSVVVFLETLETEKKSIHTITEWMWNGMEPLCETNSDKPRKIEMDEQEWEGSHCVPSTKQPVPLFTEVLADRRYS